MIWQAYLGLGLAWCVAMLVILPAWRRGVYLLFGWLLIEDVVRRLLPGQPVQVQLFKEGLLFWTYLGFFITRKQHGKGFWLPPFSSGLLIFSAVVLLDALNPDIQGMLVPAAGIRCYIWYIPLLWIGYYAFQTKTELVRFSRLLVSAALPLAVLGVMQYVFWEQLPSWLQPLEGGHTFHSAAFEYRGETIGYESKLPSSVFGSAHRFAMFSLFLFFLGVGIRGWRLPSGKRRGRFSLGLSILASLICIVAAGTRMAMLLTLIGLLLLAIEPVLTRRKGLMGRARVRQLLVGLVLGASFFGILQVFSNTGRFFLYTTGGGVKEHFWQFTEAQLPHVLKKAAWIGFGTGVLSQGLTHVPGGEEAFEFASRESEGVGIEYGLAKVTWELGAVGLALFLFLWIEIFWGLWRNLRTLHDPTIKALGCALGTFALLVFLAFLKGHYYFGDGTTLTVYWFGMGIFFSLGKLERIEAARAQLLWGSVESCSELAPHLKQPLALSFGGPS